MNFSGLFIVRPVATTLIWLGVVLSGWLAFTLLPIAPLPQIELASISVSAQMAGASPEVMAATVATPLERSLGTIAGVDRNDLAQHYRADPYYAPIRSES